MRCARAGALRGGALPAQQIAMRRAGSSRACRGLLCAAAVAAALLAGRGAAAAPNYPVADGPGLATCRQAAHLEHENPAMADGFFAWAEGFMSGLNDKYIAGECSRRPAAAQPLAGRPEGISGKLLRRPRRRAVHARRMGALSANAARAEAALTKQVGTVRGPTTMTGPPHLLRIGLGGGEIDRPKKTGPDQARAGRE